MIRIAILFVLTIIAVLASCGQMHVSQKTNPKQKIEDYEKKREEIKAKVSKIEFGTWREEIEKIILQEYGGSRDSSGTMYFLYPELIIKIPYDTSGGNLNKMNKVNGSIKVY